MDFDFEKLERFQAGAPLRSQLTAERLNGILDFIEANRLCRGVGYFVRRAANGTTLLIDLPSVEESAHPFKITAFKSGSDFKATVQAGTLNNIVPKIGSSLLTDNPPPQLSLTANATNYICLSAQFDNSSLAVVPASVKVQAFTALPANGENANNEFWGHLLLGQVVIGSAAIESVSQFVSTSEQTLRTYGLNNVIWGRV